MGLTTKEFREQRDWTRWLVVGGVIALVVVIVAALRSCGGESTDTVPPTTTTVSVSTPPSGPKGSVVPQIPDLHHTPEDPDWLTAPPTHISWQRVDGVPFPFSGSDGPTAIDGAVTSGYSHTPQGAVLAAAHISFRLVWSPDFKSVLEAQTDLSEETRTQLLSARTHSGSVDPTMIESVARAPLAFKIAGFVPARADLYLAFPGSTGEYRFVPVAVVWKDGDWKYSEVDDTVTPPVQDSADLTGFTRWEEENDE